MRHALSQPNSLQWRLRWRGIGVQGSNCRARVVLAVLSRSYLEGRDSTSATESVRLQERLINAHLLIE